MDTQQAVNRALMRLIDERIKCIEKAMLGCTQEQAEVLQRMIAELQEKRRMI